MSDSWGDGWNGNFLYIVSQNGDTLNTGGSTVAVGYDASDTVCIADGCYYVTVDYGPWQGEVSWEIVLDGDTLLEGGAPFGGLLEVGPGGCNLGCTDPAAQNYNASATGDDGSCKYVFSTRVHT
jgi:hypothetical protein